jgi:hypothetical protein
MCVRFCLLQPMLQCAPAAELMRKEKSMGQSEAHLSSTLDSNYTLALTQPHLI